MEYNYEHIPETKEDLDWAELITLDLNLFDSPEGKKELVEQLRYAAQHVGFFYVTNFGISEEDVDRQFALAKRFYQLPLEEKLKYHNSQEMRSGHFNGYRPAELRNLLPDGSIKDNFQVYNIPKFDGYHARPQPQVLQDEIAQIEDFQRQCHTKVITKLFKLLAILLELPDEDQLLKMHGYDNKGEDHLRYMFYKARTAEENKTVGGLYAAGHTDLALQIRNSLGEWKWVKPQDRACTVNISDALSSLTGGYLKSTIHRVHAPPADQAHIDRIGVLYFNRPNNNVILDPITTSPLLARLNMTENEFTRLGYHLTMEDTEGKYEYDQKHLEILPGMHAKIFN
ncbi:hypothetical protein COCMIDRAFT_41158 [Bipolaris oryzae ATCC 44560]|uniref:Fe2OG dioxygenase domain-containing protein n=1 Tax=Bipolaris oryzae ATCC 44560 TaxID=930090 RepID=W6YSN1_COCMI|nr:uncharacterized protein COCMIDRAFT_41158 [Bipolaris oryzae ATCC 44560]EUC40523.1 hypothetical protein COCMIDRAFT_41158 [Bipolaris oryzae ATCC 44560]